VAGHVMVISWLSGGGGEVDFHIGQILYNHIQ
jgi:hypothetical protein